MNPSQRDAILRVTASDDWKRIVSYVDETLGNMINSLVSVDPGNLIMIARVQGQIQGLKRIVALEEEAMMQLEADKMRAHNERS